MRIGFVCNQSVCVSGASNGIRMQALIWKDALRGLGHEVELINPWEDYRWRTFDIIHVFSYSDDSLGLVSRLKNRGCHIVMSPIIDSAQSPGRYRFYSFWGSERLKVGSLPFFLRHGATNVDMFLARSKYESDFITSGIGVPQDKVAVVPLSFRYKANDLSLHKKEDFCLHISSITQQRKNVLRLIQAAIKFNFKLVLAGSTGTDSSYAPFRSLIDSNDNISSLGFVSDEVLIDLYSRAKVFALPSLVEGVGLVALEAAMHGCDIVITNIGGPKEYYGDLAYVVNPYSVDDIGQAVLSALSNSKQPELYNHIEANYNINTTIKQLESVYKSIL